MSECYVYIVTPDGETTPCKVGISDNPYDRVSTLAIGSPVPLRLAEIYAFDTRQEAMAMERLFHQSYAEWRLHGEWFNVDFEDANFWLFENVVVPEVEFYGSSPL